MGVKKKIARFAQKPETGRMSQFTTQLRATLESCGKSRADFAAECGIPYSTLTNYAREIRAPDPTAMLAMCRALPESDAAQLLVARLLDERPDELSHLVRIETRNAPLEEPRALQIPTLGQQASDAIKILAMAAARNETWHAVIIDLATVIAPERFQPTPKNRG